MNTSDNGGKWGNNATGCLDPIPFPIPASSYSKRERLSVLLTAQSSGQNIVMEFDTCPSSTAVPATPKSISIQN